MGKGGKVTIGHWYRLAYHHGISGTPIDAFLEFRGGDKVAWSGELTASGKISINAPNLWGGEKDQGGIVGDFEVLFGDATQQPSDYLLSVFGSQVPGWRGVTTGVFRGGRFGAMNPYPQKPAYKIRAIKKGWDNDTCWYPEKAEIPLVAATTVPSDAAGWQYQVLADETNPGYENLSVPADGWLENGQAPFGSGPANGPINTDWPGHTVLWIRRTVTVASLNQQLKVTAENGCVIFINGAIAGAVNRSNAQIIHNENNVFTFPLAGGQTYDIAIKAFDESEVGTNNVTYLTVELSAPGLTAMNPAHILYELRTAQDRGAEPIESMADASWRAAADWYYSQSFGLCTEFDPGSESVEDAIARIERVAGCSVNRSPVDGLWYIDVANGVYDLASLPILTDDDILEWDRAPTVPDDAVNSLSVEYFDVQQKTTVTTPPVRALALISANGLNHDVRQFHELPTADLAARIALRELADGVTPTRAFNLTTARKPYNWRRNTYFRLQAPKMGIADMVCLLAEKSSGTLKSGAMKITAAQDIYSLPSASFSQVEQGIDTRPSQMPLGIMQQAAFEAPYIEVVRRLSRADLSALPSDVGYLMTVARDPGVSRDYTLSVSTDGGSTYQNGPNGPWCPSALVVEGDPLAGSPPATAFTLSGGALLASVAVGSPALWNGELCRVDAIDVVANTLTLGRGCADTPPATHAANERIWFYDGFAGADTTEYTDGEAIDVKLLTNTGTAQLDPSLATPVQVTFAQRQFRPYPPGGMTINNTPYPSVANGSVSVAFVERNRVTQGDQLIAASEAAVAAEGGTTYTLRGYIEGTLDATLANQAASPIVWTPSSMGSARIELVAVRDGLESNPVLHSFTYGQVLWTPSNLTSPPAVWLSDDSPVTDAGGGICAQWNDKSGNGNHFSQASSAARPAIIVSGLNGRRTVRFGGSSYLANASSAVQNLFRNCQYGLTFIVWRAVALDASPVLRTLFDHRDGLGTNQRFTVRQSIAGTANTPRMIVDRVDGDPVGGAIGSALADTAFHLEGFEIDWSVGDSTIRADGAVQSSQTGSTSAGATSDTSSAHQTSLCAQWDATTCANAEIAEVIICNRAVTADELLKIEGYLAYRWGLQANLPADHPYKSTPP